MIKLEFEDGKYTYISDQGKQEILRYGEPWRDVTGDKFIASLIDDIVQLKAFHDLDTKQIAYLLEERNLYKTASEANGKYISSLSGQSE